MKYIISVFVVLIATGFSYSQNADNQQKIKSNLEDYFHFERENGNNWEIGTYGFVVNMGNVSIIREP